MKCSKCFDPVMGCNSGEVDQGGYLDCLCGAAESRRAMEVTLGISEAPTWMRDTAWRAYSMGVAAAAPDGWQAVPIELTKEMIYSVQDGSDIFMARAKRIWAMFLGSAPKVKP